jgi:hypothetical protein
MRRQQSRLQLMDFIGVKPHARQFAARAGQRRTQTIFACVGVIFDRGV